MDRWKSALTGCQHLILCGRIYDLLHDKCSYWTGCFTQSINSTCPVIHWKPVQDVAHLFPYATWGKAPISPWPSITSGVVDGRMDKLFFLFCSSVSCFPTLFYFERPIHHVTHIRNWMLNPKMVTIHQDASTKLWRKPLAPVQHQNWEGTYNTNNHLHLRWCCYSYLQIWMITSPSL